MITNRYKTALLLSLIFINLNLFAQINKGDKEFTIDVNGYKTSSTNGMFPFHTSVTDKVANIGLKFNYYSEKYIYFGIGINYYWGKNESVNGLLVDSFYQEVVSERVTKSLIPSLKAGFNYELLNRFYFKNSLNVNFGMTSYSGKSHYTGIKMDVIDNFYSLENNLNKPTSGEFEFNQKFNYISVSLEHEFQYYVNNTLGFTLGLGGIEYAKIINEETYVWAFAFSPAFWTLGINIKI